MAHTEQGHYRKKHPADKKVDPKILEEVKKQESNGQVPCAVAFEISKKLNVPPSEVGTAMDLQEIRIAKCQLGLFGYTPEKRIVKPAESVAPELRTAIEEALVDGRLSCKDAWSIAEKLGIRKMQVSSACEAIGIKIYSCQLGAF